MMSTLPRQSAGEIDGVLKVEGYLRTLAQLPLPQLEFVVDEALKRCRWLPSPAECLAMAEHWKRSDEPVQLKARAEALARKERQARLGDARQALRAGCLSQDAIDALPERTKQILEAESLLWRCEDCGSYTARPGPSPAEGPADLAAAMDDLGERYPSQREAA